MRTAVPGLPTPHPIGLSLPALYLDDDFTQRLTAGLDEVLAPVLLTLDCLDAYLDLELAPADFLDWLAGWVAVEVDESWPVALRREVVRHAVQLHRWRGTARGVELAVRLLTGGTAEVTDTGGVSCSAEPGAAPPAQSPRAHVLIRVADPTAVDTERLRQLVSGMVPAHVPTVVEVTGQ
ncbi:phage tail protein [Melissospora conviva]|uniref:phage tail protein n=1 Tax=Melissospora conviva TaxID=3388432 RepID=UPI003B7CE2CC